jgi:hypothetical protein
MLPASGRVGGSGSVRRSAKALAPSPAKRKTRPDGSDQEGENAVRSRWDRGDKECLNPHKAGGIAFGERGWERGRHEQVGSLQISRLLCRYGRAAAETGVIAGFLPIGLPRELRAGVMSGEARSGAQTDRNPGTPELCASQQHLDPCYAGTSMCQEASASDQRPLRRASDKS